jgi:NADPH:quinone reductase-like Zn-dependent oxidoreductase
LTRHRNGGSDPGVKAIVVRQFGSPDVLRWEDVPTPSPGPGEVLVKVHAVSVNRTLDLQVRQDGGNYGVTLPLVMGCDPSGTVAAVGPRVDGVKVDDRVAAFGFVGCGRCAHCAEGNHRLCAARKMLGVRCWGGYAEYVRIPAMNCVPVPAAVSFADATVIARHFPLAFGECYLTELKRDEWALVMGAAGGLGSALVQVAGSLGAHVIAAAGTDARVAAAVALGADAGVNYRRLDLEAEVRRITTGHGADVVFENIGDPALWPGAFNALAPGGRLVTAGAHGGGFVTLDVRRLYQQRLRVISGLGGDRREDLDCSFRLAATGTLKVLIDRVLPLSEAAAAHRLVASNTPLGKVVLDPTLDTR